AAAEGAVDDRPLDGVGVLELVDEDDLEAAAQGRHDLVAARPAQRRVQAHEPGELATNGAGEPAPHGGRRLVLALDGLDRRGRVVDGERGDLQGLGAGDPRWVAPAGEAADVKVVDDLAEEVADVLDE